MKRRWLFLALAMHLSMATGWCDEQISSSEPNLQVHEEDKIYINLGDSFDLAGDLLTSVFVYNQLIAKKEATQCFDEYYVKALKRACHVYSLIDEDMSLQMIEKIQVHDKYRPVCKIVNGYLVYDKVDPELTQGECWQFFTQMIIKSGLCESEGDIELINGQIKIKLKPCCCCCKPQNYD